MTQHYSVKIINLPHRQDRKEHSIKELEKHSIEQYSFVEAKYLSNLGPKGCSLSHAKALMDFMFEDQHEFILILEDDFEVRQNINLKEIINSAISYSHLWNVFVLGHHEGIAIDTTPMQNVQRIINSHSTLAYLVKKSYVPKLVKCFLDSSNYLTNYNTLPEPNVWMAKNQVCCDILWNRLQVADIFWAPFPRVMEQIESLSDTYNRVVSAHRDNSQGINL